MKVGVFSSFLPLLGGWVRASSSSPLPPPRREARYGPVFHPSQPGCTSHRYLWLGKEGITLISRRPAAPCRRWFGELVLGKQYSLEENREVCPAWECALEGVPGLDPPAGLPARRRWRSCSRAVHSGPAAFPAGHQPDLE